MAAAQDFTGQVVLVTGASRGIGRAIADDFADAGATVIGCGRSTPAEATPFAFHACDVRDTAAVAAMVDKIGAEHGRIDVLVNNAGGSPPSDAATASPRFAERIVALNLLAPLYVSQAVLPLMRPHEGFRAIVNIASVSAVRPSPGTAVYAAAKAGLLALTRSLAQEWGPDIRVNALVVGYVATENAETTYGPLELQASTSAALGLGRFADPREIARAARFLSSPAASYVSGAALAVDGGGERPRFLDGLKKYGSGQ